MKMRKTRQKGGISMKTYEELVKEYRKRQHDTVVDTIAAGLTYVDEIAVDTGILEETGILTELTQSVTGILPLSGWQKAALRWESERLFQD